MMQRHTLPFFAGLVAVALLVFFGVRALGGGYYQLVAFYILQYVVLATAWNILGGYGGYVNFGSAGFFAIGAYTAVALYKAMALPLGLQTSVIYQNFSGIENTATYTATNAQIAPSLGRNLAACPAVGTCTATATIQLIQPFTQLHQVQIVQCLVQGLYGVMSHIGHHTAQG